MAGLPQRGQPPQLYAVANRCFQSCSACSTLCLRLLGSDSKEVSPLQSQLLRDCSEVCLMLSTFLYHGLTLRFGTCDVSARICERCSDHWADVEEDSLADRTRRACAAAAVALRQLAEQLPGRA